MILFSIQGPTMFPSLHERGLKSYTSIVRRKEIYDLESGHNKTQGHQ